MSAAPITASIIELENHLRQGLFSSPSSSPSLSPSPQEFRKLAIHYECTAYDLDHQLTCLGYKPKAGSPNCTYQQNSTTSLFFCERPGVV